MSPDLIPGHGMPDNLQPSTNWFYLLEQELTTPFSESHKRTVNRLLYELVTDERAAQPDAPFITTVHSFEVATYGCIILLRESQKRKSIDLFFSPAAEVLTASALLHDKGKEEQPALHQYSTRFSRNEYEESKEHSNLGAAIAEKAGLPTPVVDAIRYHHERVDGSGSNQGLEGESIPIVAGLTAIVDATQVALNPRPYHKNGSGSIQGELIDIHNKFGDSELKFDPRLLAPFKSLAAMLSRQGVVSYIHERSITAVEAYRRYNFDPYDTNFLKAPFELAQEIVGSNYL